MILNNAEKKYCTRCGASSHTVDQCRAKRHYFTRALLASPTNATVYVLECADNCYYVGCTHALQTRIQQHFAGIACDWTRLHKPIRLAPCFTQYVNYAGNSYASQERDEFMANVYNRGGVQHVRGWLHANADLSDAERHRIELEVCAQFSLCYKCGHHTHLAPDCYAVVRAEWCCGERYFNEQDIFTA